MKTKLLYYYIKLKNKIPLNLRLIPLKVWQSYIVCLCKDYFRLQCHDDYYVRRYLSGKYEIIGGVFKGLKYINVAHCSALLPKLVGTYESAIADWFLHLPKYKTILNIGSAEGYYAVGLARKYPVIKIVAYDTSQNARKMCKRLADLNKVYVLIKGRFNNSDTKTYKGGLILSDIEGDEITLLNPVKNRSLYSYDYIIECHDQFVPATRTLINRFRKTHTIDIAISTKNTKQPPVYLQKFTPKAIANLTYEGREESDYTIWLKLTRSK